MIMSDLAKIIAYQGRYQEAERMQSACIAQFKKISGLGHPFTLASTSNLAIYLKIQDRHREAVLLMMETEQLSRETRGHSHPRTVRFSNRLSNWGKEEEELEIGTDHEYAAWGKVNLARMLWLHRRQNEALDLMREAIDTAKQKWGEDSKTTLGLASDLESMKEEVKRIERAERVRTDPELARILGFAHTDDIAEDRGGIVGVNNELQQNGNQTGDRGITLKMA